jgi:sterol desaturase/sphingolipid hydroxylase (fatty acid hydroxylase superfamily)
VESWFKRQIFLRFDLFKFIFEEKVMLRELGSELSFSVVQSSVLVFTSEQSQLLVILMAFIVMLVIEDRHACAERPLKAFRRHYLTNISMFVFNSVMMSLLSVYSLLTIAEQYASAGLLSQISNPVIRIAVSFMLLDLTLYFWHKANHTFNFLWMFHQVHHSDPSFNVSTAFRLHLVELLLTAGLKALYIIVFGVDKAVVIISEAVITVFVIFHHMDVSVPGEKWLSRIIIVPYLHKAHHSTLREEHDHNYGAVFSIWDHLFKTIIEIRPAEIGLRYVKTQDFMALFLLGFTRFQSSRH